jgi:hypothetical protein
MSRFALLVGAVMVGFAAFPARADTVYYCQPNEPRVTAPNRLLSVEVTLRPDGGFASVVYRAANGATYDRVSQYEAVNSHDEHGQFWVGTLRINRNVGMVGALQRVGGQLFYHETVHDNLHGGKIVSHVVSLCDGGRPTYAAASPPPSLPPQPAPSPTLPQPEIKRFTDCVDAAAVVLAGTSSEPAQTIVDAAIGECGKERLALENALERSGVTQSLDFVDRFEKEFRPGLLALVLNTRASAARPSPEEPAKTEQAKGQPL